MKWKIYSNEDETVAAERPRGLMTTRRWSNILRTDIESQLKFNGIIEILFSGVDYVAWYLISYLIIHYLINYSIYY